MPKINQELDANCLEFVKQNTQLRGAELVYLSATTREAAGDKKSLRSVNDDLRKRTTPDPQNQYFIRVDLSDVSHRCKECEVES